MDLAYKRSGEHLTFGAPQPTIYALDERALVRVDDPDVGYASLLIIGDLGHHLRSRVVRRKDLNREIGLSQNGRNLVRKRLDTKVRDTIPWRVAYAHLLFCKDAI